MCWGNPKSCSIDQQRSWTVQVTTLHRLNDIGQCQTPRTYARFVIANSHLAIHTAPLPGPSGGIDTIHSCIQASLGDRTPQTDTTYCTQALRMEHMITILGMSQVIPTIQNQSLRDKHDCRDLQTAPAAKDAETEKGIVGGGGPQFMNNKSEEEGT